MKNVLAMILLLAAGVSNLAQAQNIDVAVSKKPGWHKIGETKVNFRKDTDEISIIGANKFSELKLVIKGAAIELTSVELFFDKGDTQKMEGYYHIDFNGETETIPFESGERNLRKVKFVYKTMTNEKDRRAHVEVWAYKPYK